MSRKKIESHKVIPPTISVLYLEPVTQDDFALYFAVQFHISTDDYSAVNG